MRALLAAFVLMAMPAMAADLTVNLSGTTGPDFANRLNTTDLEVARFVFQASGGDVGIDDIEIHFSNHTVADLAFTRMRLFYDANGNGSFETNEELDAASTIAPDGVNPSVVFAGIINALPWSVVAGPSRLLQLRVDVGNNIASYGDAFEFSIQAAGSITLTNPGTDNVLGSLPAVSNTLTLRHSENQLVPGTGNPTTQRTAFYGATNFPALHFIVSSLTGTPPGQLLGIDLISITVSITLANSAQTAAVTRLSLWQDDGDSQFEPNAGEVLIQARTPADGVKWDISGSVISVTFDGAAVQNLSDIPSGGVKALWVGIDFGSGMDAVCEVSVNRAGMLGALGAAADFFVVSPAFISGDVITLQAVPPRPPSSGPEGEGGCSTGQGGHHKWLLLLVLAGLLGLRISKIHCRQFARRTW